MPEDATLAIRLPAAPAMTEAYDPRRDRNEWGRRSVRPVCHRASRLKSLSPNGKEANAVGTARCAKPLVAMEGIDSWREGTCEKGRERERAIKPPSSNAKARETSYLTI